MRINPCPALALLLLLSCYAILPGCHTAVRNPPAKDSTIAATVVDVYSKSHKPNDTINAKTAVAAPGAKVDEMSEEPSLEEIYQECIDRYRYPKVIDTVFKMGDDTYRLWLKHYCLMDSGIKVPKSYAKLFHLDSFVTHNFVTELSLKKGDHELLRRTIVKKDFNQLLFPELRSYGALRAPDVRLSRDNIILGYSISIPLTDVGVGLSAVIDDHGRILFEDRRGYD